MTKHAWPIHLVSSQLSKTKTKHLFSVQNYDISLSLYSNDTKSCRFDNSGEIIHASILTSLGVECHISNTLLALFGQRTITHTGSFIYCFNIGWLLFFSFPYTFTFSCLYLSVGCPSVCLSVCLYINLCVCLSMCVCVCLCVCLSVCLMYYVYKIMYVVFIVINVCKLLYVSRPASSPRAVWNPCKINKALNK